MIAKNELAGIDPLDIPEFARDPTPEQIRERAAEIRSGWSEGEERRRRFGIPRQGKYLYQKVEENWMPQIVPTAGLLDSEA